MLEESERRTSSTVDCANLSCGSTIRRKLNDDCSGWLHLSSEISKGYYLGEQWLCSKSCLRKQVSDGILETLARPISGRLFKPMGPRIGTFLRARGWINSEQLNRALEYQKKHDLKIGKCLLKLGYLSEQKLLSALSEQLKVPCIFESISNASEIALRSVPKSVCAQFHVVPLEYRQNHILSVAVDIDLSEEIILAVQEVLGCSVQPFFITRKALQELIERFVLARPDDPVTLIDNADRIGSIFLKEWTRYRAKSARFAHFGNMTWIRYLSADVTYDHLLLFDKTIPLEGCASWQTSQVHCGL